MSRVLEVGVVEEVEELCTELQLGVPHVRDGEAEGLEGSEVHIRVGRSDQAITALTSSETIGNSERVDKVAGMSDDTGHHVLNMGRSAAMMIKVTVQLLCKEQDATIRERTP